MQTTSVRADNGGYAPYLVGAAIVWAGTFLAVAVVLEGTPYLAQLLPILAGGMVYFVVLMPTMVIASHRARPRADPNGSSGSHEPPLPT